MRRKGTGELEGANAERISAAQRMAGQWLDAGLPKRAYEELQRVAELCSFKTETGAAFHLLLARVAEECGRAGESTRLRQRVMESAESSSQRWQAEQAIQKRGKPDLGASSSPRDSPAGEMSKLFGGLGGGGW